MTLTENPVSLCRPMSLASSQGLPERRRVSPIAVSLTSPAEHHFHDRGQSPRHLFRIPDRALPWENTVRGTHKGSTALRKWPNPFFARIHGWRCDRERERAFPPAALSSEGTISAANNRHWRSIAPAAALLPHNCPTKRSWTLAGARRDEYVPV